MGNPPKKKGFDMTSNKRGEIHKKGRKISKNESKH